MKPAIVIALIKKQSGRSGPAESNDYLWDVATESAWFFSNCVDFLVVLPFKFWSLSNCIQLYRKEKVRRKPKGSIEESIFEIFFFKLTFLSCKFYATASFDISHTWSTYLIIVIFFTLTQFLEHKIYTEKRQFFALNL